MEQIFLENNRFKIKTVEGYKPFAGISESAHSSYVKITLENSIIEAGTKHIFWLDNGNTVYAKNLKKSDYIIYNNNKIKVLNIETINASKTLFDIIEIASSDHSFIINKGVKTHNCQFLTFEKTLIDSEILNFYQTSPVEIEINDFKFYKSKLDHPDSMIIITIDPSAGGDDASVIQIWEISPKQTIELASLNDPDLDAAGIFEKILWLQEYLKEKFNYSPDDALLIFERNGIGEGLAQILTQTEKATELLEIPIFYDNKGHPGFHTTPTTKSKLALQFKNLLEYNKLKINDTQFIEELYGFVRTSGGQYMAKSGYHDDRVTSAFLIVHYLYNVFAEYAQGEFSIDTLLLVKPEEKILTTNNEEVDPALIYRQKLEKENNEEQLKKEELSRIEEEKRKEREAWAQQAAMGSSIVEEDDDDDDIDLDEYDIMPSIL